MTPQVKLKLDDGFFGCFKMDSGQSIVAPLITLHVDKALIALSKKEINTLQTGDRVDFHQIIGATNICFNDHIPVKIQWIKPMNQPPHHAAACGFFGVEDTVRHQLVQFIEAERLTRGQYR